jgi:hypothetical protein
MSDASHRPLPAAIERLLLAEREAPPPAPAVASRVLRRLNQTLGASVPAVGGSLLASTKLYLAGAALAVGVAALGARMGERPPDVRAIAPVSPPAPAIGPSPRPLPPAVPASRARPSAPASVPAASGGDDLAEQSALLLAARRTLAAGNADHARQLLRRHARRWPHGALEQEREILLMDTLAASGDRAGARQRAERFLRRFGGSTLAQPARQHLDDKGGAGPKKTAPEPR